MQRIDTHAAIMKKFVQEAVALNRHHYAFFFHVDGSIHQHGAKNFPKSMRLRVIPSPIFAFNFDADLPSHVEELWFERRQIKCDGEAYIYVQY